MCLSYSKKSDPFLKNKIRASTVAHSVPVPTVPKFTKKGDRNLMPLHATLDTA